MPPHFDPPVVQTPPDRQMTTFYRQKHSKMENLKKSDPVLSSDGFRVHKSLSRRRQIVFLIHRLVESGRKVVGFDIVEVAPSTTGDEWDANVGARLLYKLCGALGQSSGLGFL